MTSTQILLPAPLDFVLPPELEAGEPPEARGLGRDGVRLLVSYLGSDRTIHTRFPDIVQYLDDKDVLVLNTSGTINAAVPATRADGTALLLHLSTHLPDGHWTVELRSPSPHGSTPCGTGRAGETIQLPGGGTVTLNQPYMPTNRRSTGTSVSSVRLWLATLQVPGTLASYLEKNGSPVR